MLSNSPPDRFPKNLEIVDNGSLDSKAQDLQHPVTHRVSRSHKETRRVKAACKRCRTKRRKCNGLQPCGNCSKSKSECSYEIENKRKPLNKKYVDSLLEKIEFLSSVIGSKTLDLNKVNHKSSIAALLKSPNANGQNAMNYHAAFKLDMDEHKLITFHGPSSYRHMSSPPLIVKPGHWNTAKAITGDDHKLFDWFFQNINKDLPLIDRTLFDSSIANEEMEFNRFVSNSLINAILATTLSRMNDPNYVDYKDLAAKQVMEELSSVNITQVQALVLLSLLEMTDNTEVRSSCYMSMAVALSNHLGLHLYTNDMPISKAEKELRQKLFWCCFIVDRSRSPILGMDPYLDSEDISTHLPISSSSDELLILRELCILLDIQTNAIKSIYSLRFQLMLKGKNKARQELAYIDANVNLSKWVKELPSICRSKNDIPDHPNMRMVLIMELFYYITQLVISKPFTKTPYDPKLEQNDELQSYNLSCNIITLVDKIDYKNCALLHLIPYGLYISTVCFFFNYHSPNTNIRETSYINCRKGVSIMKSMSEFIPVAKVYYDRIKIVKSDWKVQFDLEENEDLNNLEVPKPADVDFSNFIWSDINEYMHEDPTSLLGSINFYEVFGS